MWDFLRHTGIADWPIFYMELYRKLVCFFLNISIIIADINTVQTTLCSEISPLYFDLFFKIFCQKKISPFARQPTLPILILNR